MVDRTEKQVSIFRCVCFWGLLISLCVVFALTRSFTSFASYDDESYIMMTLQSFLQGHRLYGDTYTQYGPAFYFLQTPIHGWLNLPISHDVVRLKTVAVWVSIALLSGAMAMRLTGKQLVAAAVTLFTMLHLEKLGLEPAHPQEIIALLAAVGLLIVGSRNRVALILAGVCAAFMGLTKLNAGAIIAAAFLFAVSCGGVKNWHNRILFGASALLCCALPTGIVLLVSKQVGQFSEVAFLLWPVCLAIATVLVCGTVFLNRAEDQLSTETSQHGRLAETYYVIAGGVIGSLVVLGWAVANGNSVDELTWGILWQHAFMAESFYGPVVPTFLDFMIAIAVASVVACNFIYRFRRLPNQSLEHIMLLMPVLALAISTLMLTIECWRPIEHGLNSRGAARFLATVGPLLMPILIWREISVSRLAVAMCGCLGPILAFPVPGSQVALGTVPVLIGLIVSSHDALSSESDGLFIVQARSWQRYCCIEFGAVFVAVAIFLSTLIGIYRWGRNEPLDQPGCRWVRLEPAIATTERKLAAAIRRTDADYLSFDLQNHNRFYFWTGKRPLTQINPTFWPCMLTKSQQLTIRDQLDRVENVCVVKIPAKGVELENFCPEIASSMFDSWELSEIVANWRVGLRRKTVPAALSVVNRPAT